MGRTAYHHQNLAAAILQRAREDLQDSGGEAVSLRQIAKFLNVTPAAVYRHFPDKSALMNNLLRNISQEFDDAIHQHVLNSPDAETMLGQMATNFMEFAAKQPAAFDFLTVSPTARQAPFDSVPGGKSLRTVMTLLVAQQSLPVDPDRLADDIWASLMGQVVASRLMHRSLTGDVGRATVQRLIDRVPSSLSKKQ